MVVIPIVITVFILIIILIVIAVIVIPHEVAIAVTHGHAGADVVIGIGHAELGFQHRTGGVVIDHFHLFVVANGLNLRLVDAAGHFDGGIAVALKAADQPIGVDRGKADAGGKGEHRGKCENAFHLESPVWAIAGGSRPKALGWVQEPDRGCGGICPDRACQPRQDHKARDGQAKKSAQGLGGDT